mmetsp:Transcript_23077/g.39258  ORF Transcript_23077/g.39258 Transcript_23077/m.39258 type:complete len:259 (+) Transcript_23077:1126-1902(+)
MFRVPFVKPLASSNAETAVASSRLIRSPSTTRGTKFNSTPNGLNSTVISPPSCATGMGYSPPARNFASWPDSAERFGSAKVRTIPFFSSACSMTLISNAPALRLKKPVPRVSGFRARAPVVGSGAWLKKPVAIRLRLFVISRSVVSALETLRCISAKRTFSITCCTPPTTIRLETRSGAYRSAKSRARCKRWAEDTVPDMTMPSLAERTSIFSLGRICFKRSLNSDRSGATRTSTLVINLPVASSKVSVVKPGDLPST